MLEARKKIEAPQPQILGAIFGRAVLVLVGKLSCCHMQIMQQVLLVDTDHTAKKSSTQLTPIDQVLHSHSITWNFQDSREGHLATCQDQGWVPAAFLVGMAHKGSTNGKQLQQSPCGSSGDGGVVQASANMLSPLLQGSKKQPHTKRGLQKVGR